MIKKYLVMALIVLGSSLVGYLIHQPKVIDHYVTQETIKHDCAVQVLAIKFPKNIGVSRER